MQPRLRLDITWRDLASVWLPLRRRREALEASIAAHAEPDFNPVVGLSVRSLFDAILAETLAGRPVVMTAVTIADMASLVQAHGGELRPADIALDTLAPSSESIRDACRDDAGLIVVVHLFGGRLPLDEIADRHGAPGRLIVEDCAQAFDGRLKLSVGADVALYSFGPIKTATALGGAVALFRDPDLADRVLRRMEGWPALPDSWFLRRAGKYAGLKLLSNPVLYGLLLAALRGTGRDAEATIGRLARGFSGAAPLLQAIRHRPPLRMLRLLGRRLERWSPAPSAEQDLLSRLSGRLTVPGLAANPARWWLIPVLAPDPDGLIGRLRFRGFDATRGATSMRALADADRRSPPNSTRLIESVVYLPKPLSRQAADRLAAAVEQALGR